jgi:hypothetical protein
MPDTSLIYSLFIHASTVASGEPFVLIRLGEYVRDRCGDRMTTAWFGVAIAMTTGIVSLAAAEVPKHLRGAPVARRFVGAVLGIASVLLVAACITLAIALLLTPEPHESGHGPTWAGPMMGAFVAMMCWAGALRDRIRGGREPESPLLK